MLKRDIAERPHWRDQAKEFGFGFHTMYGEPYWDESAYYQFTLNQIEQGIEAPTEEIHQMCLQAVDQIVRDDYWLKKFQIPEHAWDPILTSWKRKDPSLYSRLDLAYNGKDPAKLYENNADTPTSLYETGFWQWLWLEDQVNAGRLRRDADQFNLVQELMIQRFTQLASQHRDQTLYFCCCQDTDEDFGTVQYMRDCADEAGLTTDFIYIDDIGLSSNQQFTDLNNKPIEWIFKLYPWEFMLREEYAQYLGNASTSWLEPLWKAIISNKAILPYLWKMYPNHPNLLAAYFAEDQKKHAMTNYVKKPLFSREGANISIFHKDELIFEAPGPYGEEGFIYQEYYPLPKFQDNYTLIGSWLIDDKAAGIAIREDKSKITQDLSRYIPHIIL